MKVQFSEHNIQRALNIIRRAVEFGFNLDEDLTFRDILDGCESQILTNVEFDRMEHCELSHSNGKQNYQYSDEKGFSCEADGEIFDLSLQSGVRAEHRILFRISDRKFVNRFDIPSDKRHEYAFIFARVVDSDGKVVALYDNF